MIRSLFLLLLLPYALCRQQGASPSREELTVIYTKAIGDFIEKSNSRNNNRFDTLYFGKRHYGQPDDFPGITLPEMINDTHIRLIAPEEGAANQKIFPSRKYINMMGWVNQTEAEFIFVVFSNGFEQQYNCTFNYKRKQKQNEFELTGFNYHEPALDE